MKISCFGKVTYFFMFGYNPENEPKKKKNLMVWVEQKIMDNSCKPI